MALANDMSELLRKISKRLGLLPLDPHLPEFVNKEAQAEVIMDDTMVTFSRYYPHVFPLVINDDTCYKQYGDKHSGAKAPQGDTVWYIIKDEVLKDIRLLGLRDIDFLDSSVKNSSLATSLGGGMYLPSYACPEATFETMLSLQFGADMRSLYNNGLYLDFQYPNRFAVKGLGNTSYDLTSFVVELLVQHKNLSTISPTKMETFEALAQADIANFLYENLKYWDGLETIFVNVDLKLSDLQDHANKREEVLNRIIDGYVSTSSDTTPYIWTI